MKTFVILFLNLFICFNGICQELRPVIKDFGGIYEIPEATERPDPEIDYKILLDLKSGPESPLLINPALVKIARMYNLHGIAGVPKERLNVVGVVHALATIAVVSNKAYNEKYGVDNPNTELIEALAEAGVRLIVCGQSILAWGFEFDDIHPEIALSISAVTALTTYQMREFNLLEF